MMVLIVAATNLSVAAGATNTSLTASVPHGSQLLGDLKTARQVVILTQQAMKNNSS